MPTKTAHLWDRDLIEEGRALVVTALRGGAPGPYALQAAIVAVHDEAASVAPTDWPQIVALYDVLGSVAPSPLVALNRAVAVAMVDGPAAGLALIDSLTGPDAYHLLHATRADLLAQLGRQTEAAAGYRRALDLVGNGPGTRIPDPPLSVTTAHEPLMKGVREVRMRCRPSTHSTGRRIAEILLMATW